MLTLSKQVLTENANHHNRKFCPNAVATKTRRDETIMLLNILAAIADVVNDLFYT